MVCERSTLKKTHRNLRASLVDFGIPRQDLSPRHIGGFAYRLATVAGQHGIRLALSLSREEFGRAPSLGYVQG